MAKLATDLRGMRVGAVIHLTYGERALRSLVSRIGTATGMRFKVHKTGRDEFQIMRLRKNARTA